MDHPGRMRLAFAREVMCWAKEHLPEKNLWVADALAGIGTTLVAAAYELDLAGVALIEKDPEVYKLLLRTCKRIQASLRLVDGPPEPLFIEALLGTAQEKAKESGRSYHFQLKSPMFHFTHDQGHTENQKEFRRSKKTNAGNCDGLATAWRGEKKWRASVRGQLGPWAAMTSPEGLFLLHTRRCVREGEVEKPDLWAVEELAPWLDPVGVLIAPMTYLTHFREIHTRPLRKVLTRTPNQQDPKLLDLTLEGCPHTPARDKVGPGGRIRCQDCPVIPIPPEVLQERVVVFRRRAA